MPFDAEAFLTYWGFERIKNHDEHNIMASCFCSENHSNDDRKRSFGMLKKPKFNPLAGTWVQEGTANCYVCGGWNIYQLTAELLNRKSKEIAGEDDMLMFTELDAAKWLEKKGWEPEETNNVATVMERINQIQEEPVHIPVSYTEDILTPYLKQLHKVALRRGETEMAISVPTARDWKLGYDPVTRRVIIPVFKEGGGLAGVISRAVDEDNFIRYGVGTVNPEWQEKGASYVGEKMLYTFDKGMYIFGEHRWNPNLDTLLIIESPLDVIYAFENDLHREFNIGAIFGSKMTRRQIEKALRHKYIIEGLDNDKPGKEGRDKLHRDLLGKTRLYTFDSWGRKDLGCCTPEEVQGSAARFQPVSANMFSHIKEME